MSQDKVLTRKKLSGLWRSGELETLDIEGNKYAMISDIHLGDGGKADDFHKNDKALERALDYYKRKRYKLIMLGDIEEFWQFDVETIENRYNNSVYKKIRALGDENVYRVWGNHDSEWKIYDDPTTEKREETIGAHQALKMKDAQGKARILLLHGHQGSTESDKSSWSSRYWVRVFKKVEPIAKIFGLYGHPSATKSQIAKDYERIFYSWAKKNKVIVICGHSHRAIFASRSYIEKLDQQIRELQKVILDKSVPVNIRKRKIKELEKKLQAMREEELKNRRITPTESKPKPCYFNTGCGLYTDGITAIEIADDQIRLVKWHRKIKKGSERDVFEQDSLSDFIKDVTTDP